MSPYGKLLHIASKGSKKGNNRVVIREYQYGFTRTRFRKESGSLSKNNQWVTITHDGWAKGDHHAE